MNFNHAMITILSFLKLETIQTEFKREIKTAKHLKILFRAQLRK